MQPHSAYLIPFIMTQITEISKSGESRPSGVIDDNIEAAKLFRGFLHQSNCILDDSNILSVLIQQPKSLMVSIWSTYGLYDCGFHSEPFDLFSHLVGSLFTAHIVDSNIGTFGGESLA